jgi:uncharacterized protein (DUF2132 family)
MILRVSQVQSLKERIGYMSVPQANNPLHGITLRKIVVSLVEYYGWEELAKNINIGCFKNEPTINSSLKLLRKIPWAREKTEKMYLEMQEDIRSGKDWQNAQARRR